jgi:hypothetical protein
MRARSRRARVRAFKMRALLRSMEKLTRRSPRP